MEKLKIGDKVQILPTLGADVNILCDRVNAVESMLQYAGKIATIVHICSTSGLDKWIYTLDIDNGDWNWTSRMFTPNSITTGKRKRNRSITF